MRTAFALALAAGFALAAPARAEDPVSLKWALKEGDTFYAKSVADMDIGMSIVGMDIDLKMKVTSVQRFKTVSVKPGATTVEMMMVDMRIAAEGIPGGIPGLGDVGKRVKGATITAVLNGDMEVTKLEGYEKFLDKLAGDDDAARTAMKGQFSEAAVGQMVSQVFSYAPKKAVKVGDTWSRTDKVPTGGFGDATVKQKYKLESVAGGVAKVGLEGDMAFKQGDGGIPGLPPGVKITKFDLKADKFAGALQFDTKAGRLKESQQNMAMSGAITMSANGMDIEIKMKLKAKQTATISEKSPVVD